MGSRALELTLISAKGLKDIGKFSKMDVYVVVTVNGDSRTEQKTPVDQDGGSSPKWSHPMKFTIDEKAAEGKLDFKLRHERVLLGDKDVGEVHLPIKELLDKAAASDDGNSVLAEFPVITSSGKEKGKLKISYKLGTVVEQFTPPVNYPVDAKQYPPPGPVMGMNYPPPAGYPPQPAGYPMSGPPMYGYPPAGYPPQYGGYPGGPQGGYPYYQQQQQQSSSGMGMGAAVGAGVVGGLVGGLVLGEIVSDVADDGFDADF